MPSPSPQNTLDVQSLDPLRILERPRSWYREQIQTPHESELLQEHLNLCIYLNGELSEVTLRDCWQ